MSGKCEVCLSMEGMGEEQSFLEGDTPDYFGLFAVLHSSLYRLHQETLGTLGMTDVVGKKCK